MGPETQIQYLVQKSFRNKLYHRQIHERVQRDTSRLLCSNADDWSFSRICAQPKHVGSTVYTKVSIIETVSVSDTYNVPQRQRKSSSS